MMLDTGAAAMLPCSCTPVRWPARRLYIAVAWNAATSRSKARSASARPRWPSGSPHASTPPLVLEETENPFLADFYADRPGAALQAQLFYLLNRHRQQITLQQADLFSQTTICDYLFDKDKIFAYQPRRQRAVHLPAALRSARARRAAARSRHLPAGADRRAAPPPAQQRIADDARARAGRRLPARAERGLSTTSSSTTRRRRCWWSRPRSSISTAATRRSTTCCDRSTARWARRHAATTSPAAAEVQASRPEPLYSALMAWFKKTASRSPPRRESQPGARRAVGQVSRTARRSSTTRISPPTCTSARSARTTSASARSSGCACCSTASWIEHDAGPALDRPAELHRHQALQAAPQGRRRGHRHEGRGHLATGRIDGIETVGRGDGIRLHRRQHGRGGRREDHARHRARHRSAGCRSSSSAARAARA